MNRKNAEDAEQEFFATDGHRSTQMKSMSHGKNASDGMDSKICFPSLFPLCFIAWLALREVLPPICVNLCPSVAKKNISFAPLRFILLLMPLLLTCCGYRTTELFPEQYRTVSAPIFENRTFYRGVETDLAEALVKEIEQRTPYKVTATTSADTELTGTIVAVRQQSLSRTASAGFVEEQEVTLVIDFEWKDLRSGEVIASRKGFEQAGRAAAAAPVGEPFSVAQHNAVQRLARDMVNTMRGEW
jgi:hypothetical protein